ncbi:hypothetical protein V5799_023435 [Amblyomma americanum]|uniref:Tick transposon n=1 Tax=Amblyomma americanum TaxID=6943 RepID=A0AAQ4FHU7_AMBAM
MDVNKRNRKQKRRKNADSNRRLSADANAKGHGSKAPESKGAPSPQDPAQRDASKTPVSGGAMLSGANKSERKDSAPELAPDCGKLTTTASSAAPSASAGEKKRASLRTNVERREESSSKTSESTSVNAVQQTPSDARPRNQMADSGRSAARQRAAEKREAIRRDHLERKSRKQAPTSPVSVAGTVLYRTADRAASFRILPRRDIVEAMKEIRGVAAVRVNFQRNVVAVDVAERSAVEALLAMDSVSGLRVVGRETAARPGTSSGVVYTGFEGDLEGCEEAILSDVPVASARPSRNGRSVLLRFDAPEPPPYVRVCWQRLILHPNRPLPLQCHNCGRFNHATASCQHPARCMRCGQSGGHSQGPCELAAKCGNCNGPHAMTDYRCRIWKQERRVEAALASANVTSRREARAIVRAACSDLESRRAKKRRSGKQAVLLKKKCTLQPEEVQVASQLAVGGVNKAMASQAVLPNVLAHSPCSNLPQPNGSRRVKTATLQRKTSVLLDKTRGARDAGTQGKCSGDALPLQKGTLLGRTGYVHCMTTKPLPAKQRSTSAEWASTPQGITCPVKNQAYPSGHAAAAGRAQTKRAASQTTAAAPKQASSTTSASASGVSSHDTGTSTEVRAPPRDQEEAYYSVLAQLASAMKAYCKQISPPVAEGNVKKKSRGKKRW